MYLPKSPGKTSLEQLSEIAKADWDGSSALQLDAPIVLKHQAADGLCYDLLWKPKPGTRRLFVLFSGDALRDKNDPPVFQRWSWADLFPGHCLFVSDPALHLDASLGLAWYSGTTTADPMQTIARLVTQIAAQCRIAPQEIYFYGSSGGGFAAIRMLAALPAAAAIAINPQTNINAYKSRSVQHYYDICFDGLSKAQMMAKFSRQISLIALIDILRGKRIVIAQNKQDSHHFNDHFAPFCNGFGVAAEHAPTDPRLRRILFDVEGGHKKAEDMDTFQKIIGLVEAGL